MRQDWISREAADMPPMPSDLLRPETKPLSEISEEREMHPPAETRTNPTGDPTPAEPMSVKEISGVLESAAKAVLDSRLSMEKAHVALSKVRVGVGPSAIDKGIVAKTQEYVTRIEKMNSTIEALAMEIGAYREEMSKPQSHWLE